MRVLLLFLLASCGKVDLKVDKIDPVLFGPDFEKAIKICDERYGVKTAEAEQCFKDYRTFFSPKVILDAGSVTKYCAAAYTDPIEIQNCETNLTSLIK